MATFTHYLQGTTDTEIGSVDALRFADGDFDGKIKVDEYNDSTHVRDGNDDSEKSAGNSPNNNHYVDDSLPFSDGDCALRINFAYETDTEISDAIIYAYDGSDTSSPPEGVVAQMAESGDDVWTEAGGSGNALSLDDKAISGDHDFYVAFSAKPTTIGAKSGKYRIELTYS